MGWTMVHVHPKIITLFCTHYKFIEKEKKKKNHLTTIEQCYNNLTLDLIHFESLGLIRFILKV